MMCAVKGAFAVLTVALVACQGSPTAASRAFIRSDSVVVKTLGAAQVSAIPSGQLYVLVQEFRQPPHSEFGSNKHDAGFIYLAAGTQVFLPLEGEPVLLHAGDAYFQHSIAHRHQNPDSTPNDWYHLALFPTSAQSQPPVNPLAQRIFASSAIPSGALPAGPAGETLRLITIQPSGHTEPHRHGGVEVLVVLQGSLRLLITGVPAQPFGSNQGTMVLPGTDMQERNVGQEVLVYLSFVVTPMGQPFEVPVGGSV